MTKKDPRKMALQIAGLRANETHLPENERIFEDPYAAYFFPEDIRRMARDVDWVKRQRAQYEAIMPGVNGALAARIKYMDECLEEAVRAGFGQLVIVGAGYDTRAHRIEGVKGNMSVFEIDHPLTQQVKKETIRQLFGQLPNHVTYLPLEFGKDRIDTILLKSNYDPGQKTFFIAEGLLMYLPEVAVIELLTFIVRASAKDSVLVADYFDAAVVNGTSPLKEAQTLIAFVEKEGTPLQFGIPSQNLETFFRQNGFSSVCQRTSAWCKEKFFTNASRGRNVSPMFNFVYAVS